MKIIDEKAFRNHIRLQFSSFITQQKKIINLEKGIYNRAIQDAKKQKIVRKWDNVNFVQIYLNIYRTLLANLDPKSHVNNNYLLNKLENDKLSAYHLVFMNEREMYPEKWKELIDKKIKRDNNMYEENLAAATDEFKCYKCSKRQCTYYQLQTRSADEPMTTFVTCLNCGNNWKC